MPHASIWNAWGFAMRLLLHQRGYQLRQQVGKLAVALACQVHVVDGVELTVNGVGEVGAGEGSGVLERGGHPQCPLPTALAHGRVEKALPDRRRRHHEHVG